jgi:hypothetical protein
VTYVTCEGRHTVARSLDQFRGGAADGSLADILENRFDFDVCAGLAPMP